MQVPRDLLFKHKNVSSTKRSRISSSVSWTRPVTGENLITPHLKYAPLSPRVDAPQDPTPKFQTPTPAPCTVNAKPQRRCASRSRRQGQLRRSWLRRSPPPSGAPSLAGSTGASINKCTPPGGTELFIDNLLVQIHYIIVMIRWTGLAPWEFELLENDPP